MIDRDIKYKNYQVTGKRFNKNRSIRVLIIENKASRKVITRRLRTEFLKKVMVINGHNCKNDNM